MTRRETMESKERAAVLWAALGKIAEKEGRRADLCEGATYDVTLAVAGDVGGQATERQATAVLSVGHGYAKASPAGPPAAHLVACILDKLNGATRQKLLDELPEAFARAGGLPEVDKGLIDAAEGMLRRLRSKDQVVQKGAVSCRYELAVPGAGHPRQGALR